MDDLISRTQAIDAVSRGCQEFRGIFAECEKNLNELPVVQTCDDAVSRQQAVDAFMTATSDGDKAEWCKWVLEQLPSAQPEIIRCKDCKHYKQSEWLLPYMSCHYVIGSTVIRESDDFCSRAERRTDGN